MISGSTNERTLKKPEKLHETEFYIKMRQRDNCKVHGMECDVRRANRDKRDHYIQEMGKCHRSGPLNGRCR